MSDVCTALNSHSNSIRFAPPLVISEEDLMRAVDVIKSSLEDLDKVSCTDDILSDWLLKLSSRSSRTSQAKWTARRATKTHLRFKVLRSSLPPPLGHCANCHPI